MNLQELANKESELYSKVVDLNSKQPTAQNNRLLDDIYEEYKLIHQSYANLSVANTEALKRGLFIQWIVATEPSYLTGISTLDENAVTEILKQLDVSIKEATMDPELKWMIGYYINWEWVFEKLINYEKLRKEVDHDKSYSLPNTINREEMDLRGQMGNYWNSLTIFARTS